MAKIKIKNSVTAGSAPSGLSFGEMAVNITDKKIFIGNAVEGVVTLHDQQNVVTSINGATGAITGLTASQVLVTSSNANATRYLAFVGGTGNTGIFIDDVTTPLTYNPLGGNIGAKKVTLTTSANVITVDSAGPSVVLTDGSNVSTFGVDSFAANYVVEKFIISNTIGITLIGGGLGLGQGIGIECGSGTKYELPLINGKAGQAVVWPSSGNGLTWSDMVTSVNGATGAVTNVARTNVAQTFTQLQDFSAGLSATSGCSFNNATVYITNSSAVDPLYVQHASANALKISTTGQARSGAIRLGNTATATQNTFISQTDGTLTLYNGLSTTGSNMISISTTAITIPTTISGATFSGLLRSSSGISAELGICGGTYMSSGGGYRITSNAIRTLTGTTYTLLSTDDGKIITSSNNSTQIFTVPSGLPVGFNCSVIQLGTGVVGFSAASGVTMNSFAGKTFMAGQHAAVSIIGYSTNIFNLSGGLTT